MTDADLAAAEAIASGALLHRHDDAEGLAETILELVAEVRRLSLGNAPECRCRVDSGAWSKERGHFLTDVCRFCCRPISEARKTAYKP